MTDQEIRIAIAKARGWKWDEKTIFDPSGKLTQNRYAYDPNGEVWYDRLFGVLPKYTEDLNATHEVEKWLKHEYRGGYFQDPTQAFNRYEYSLYIAYGILPTARQRCEALLKTLNLWKDDI